MSEGYLTQQTKEGHMSRSKAIIGVTSLSALEYKGSVQVLTYPQILKEYRPGAISLTIDIIES